mmetsp:Transcript_20319/g.44216  ORF Transcript_20319/g.44216 Transcript_20319/m.44216 type:complete len:268 (-) Transcript_20319:542-1345(-)
MSWCFRCCSKRCEKIVLERRTPATTTITIVDVIAFLCFFFLCYGFSNHYSTSTTRARFCCCYCWCCRSPFLGCVSVSLATKFLLPLSLKIPTGVCNSAMIMEDLIATVNGTADGCTGGAATTTNFGLLKNFKDVLILVIHSTVFCLGSVDSVRVFHAVQMHAARSLLLLSSSSLLLEGKKFSEQLVLRHTAQLTCQRRRFCVVFHRIIFRRNSIAPFLCQFRRYDSACIAEKCFAIHIEPPTSILGARKVEHAITIIGRTADSCTIL